MSVGLVTRRSIVGAIIVLSVALTYTLVLPMISGATKGAGAFTPGEPYVVADIMQIAPAVGWALDPTSGELFTTFTKSGAAVLIVPPAPATQPADEAARVAVGGFANDTTTTWVIGDP